MNDSATRLATSVVEPPRASTWRWLRNEYFSSQINSLITLSIFAALVWLGMAFFQWAIFDSVWTGEDADKCSETSGACWSVIHVRWRLILFGLYPADEQWRSAIACLVVVVTAILSCIPWFWSVVKIPVLWLAGFLGFFVLMFGDVAGLTRITTDQWGGLALTVFVFASVIVIGMPMAIILAFARRSTMPVISFLAGFLIDTVRSLPLLTILFTAAVVFPIFLPGWASGDKLTRVIVGFALFFACYQAEILRGGLQTIPDGQREAAKALGLSYLQRVFLILLPQAFRATLPATINQFVVSFKETALVSIIGFFELLSAGAAAFGTGDWSHAYVEVYVFVALIYFVFVFSLSRYGAYLERRMGTADH